MFVQPLSFRCHAPHLDSEKHTTHSATADDSMLNRYVVPCQVMDSASGGRGSSGGSGSSGYYPPVPMLGPSSSQSGPGTTHNPAGGYPAFLGQQLQQLPVALTWSQLPPESRLAPHPTSSGNLHGRTPVPQPVVPPPPAAAAAGPTHAAAPAPAAVPGPVAHTLGLHSPGPSGGSGAGSGEPGLAAAVGGGGGGSSWRLPSAYMQRLRPEPFITWAADSCHLDFVKARH
jgi:hypothetical protein